MEIKEGAFEDYSVRSHSHNELQIGFVEKGSSKITCKTLAFDMQPDQTILIPPGVVHLCQPDEPGRFKFTILYIDTGWFETAFKINVGRLKPQTAQLDRRAIKTRDRFIKLFRTGDDPLCLESEAIMFLGDSILCRLDLQPEKEFFPQKNNELLRVKTYIDENFQEQIQLDHLAGIAEMTKFSLLRKFKVLYKLTPHACLINLRINHAKQLLLQGNTVAQTAVTCGFFDQSHFVKTFRQYVGIAPINYK